MAARNDDHWEQVDYFKWLRVFTRLPMTSTVKLVGYALATNATASTGHDAHPGNELLMVQTGLSSEKTIRNALAELRRLRLVERRFRGSTAGRRGLADMYYLTLSNEARIAAGMKPCDCGSETPAPETAKPDLGFLITGTRNRGYRYRCSPGTPVSEVEHRYLTTRNTGTRNRPPTYAPTL